MTLLAETFYLGANAKVQAIRFALCLALGLASGIIALLYLRKARPVERALTDFFATICIGALFFVCVEFFLDGKFELYGLAAYVSGTLPIPLVAKKILAKKRRTDGEQTSLDNPQSLPDTKQTDEDYNINDKDKNKNKITANDSNGKIRRRRRR